MSELTSHELDSGQNGSAQQTSGRTGMLDIEAIRTDGGTQTRVSVNQETVDDYADAISGDTAMPPVVVFHDGENYFLADGFHRLSAARATGRSTVAAEIRIGDKIAALRYALGANCHHGLRRTNADKRNCVFLALQHFNDQSDRALAELCGVGHHLVAEVRKELGETPSSTKRVGLDGKSRRRPGPKNCSRETASSAPASTHKQVTGSLLSIAEGEVPMSLLDGSVAPLKIGFFNMDSFGEHLQSIGKVAEPATSAEKQWKLTEQKLTVALANVVADALGDQPSLEDLLSALQPLGWLYVEVSNLLTPIKLHPAGDHNAQQTSDK